MAMGTWDLTRGARPRKKQNCLKERLPNEGVMVILTS
jgi:hypothetical protein